MKIVRKSRVLKGLLLTDLKFIFSMILVPGEFLFLVLQKCMPLKKKNKQKGSVICAQETLVE